MRRGADSLCASLVVHRTQAHRVLESRGGLSSQCIQLCGRELPDNYASEETGRAPASLSEGRKREWNQVVSEAEKLRKKWQRLLASAGARCEAGILGSCFRKRRCSSPTQLKSIS